jgi:hypothetical protein
MTNSAHFAVLDSAAQMAQSAWRRRMNEQSIDSAERNH